MVRHRASQNSLRASRLEIDRLVLAVFISLLLHGLGWSGYMACGQLGWLTKWAQKHHWLAVAQPPKLQPLPPPTQDPATFVDVTIDDPEPPVDAKYYSSKNSRAANPDVSQAANQPKLDGHQKHVPKTEDTLHPSPLQPAPPEQPQPQNTAKANPDKTQEPEQKTGDLDPWKKHASTEVATANAATPPQTPPRPRTLKQARASQQILGQQMQQAGGVPRHALSASLDAKATPFGIYDRALVEAVTQRWWDLLDKNQFALDRSGRVTVKFRLHDDGRITDLEIEHNEVGPLLAYVCRDAIEQAAPFAKWPSDMMRMVGANYRDIGFTFFYE
jgi:hypothetical protein